LSIDTAPGPSASGTDRPAPEPSPIDLSRATLIGHGWKRDCYLHPDDPGLCIKVPSAKPKGTRRFRERFIEWRTGGSVGDQHNAREWAAYERFGGLLADYLPAYHGFIATTRGRGLLIDVVRDADGTPSAHLKDWLRDTPVEQAAPLLAQLDGLLDLLLRHEVWLMDLNLTNFVARIGSDGAARPMLIDIKRIADNKELFQVSGWSRTLMRRKLARRIARFHAKVEMTQNG
jgi:hypothetical protein